MPVFVTRTQKTQRDAGGLMMIGWEGNELKTPLSLIEEYSPAGLIFFRRNYPPGGGDELASQFAAFQAKSLEVSDRPLILAVDDEGGPVKRLPPPHIQLPGAPAQAARGPVMLRVLAKSAAKELKELGFNLNLAPVLDLGDPGGIMAERAYAPDAFTVAESALAFIKGFKDAGVFCCGKHFPGLGAASADPHNEAVTVALSENEMRPHIRPFEELTLKGLELVMTSHCRYPGLSQDLPATFDSGVVGLLRRRLGHEGLILTDDLDMEAAALDGGSGRAAAEAVLAGHDLVLVCRDRRNIAKCHRALSEALVTGLIAPARFQESSKRLHCLLGRL
jgi:beta-N-acetylhexosaminidase